MHDTFTRRRDGETVTVVGTFVSARTVEREGLRTTRLLFEGAEGRFAALLEPGCGCPAAALRTGGEYRLAGFEVVRPVDEARNPPTGLACPECEGELRAAQAIDGLPEPVARAVDALDLDGTFLVGDGESTVAPLDAERADDWRSMDVGRRPRRSGDEYVCRDCGETVDRRELRARGDDGAPLESPEPAEVNHSTTSAAPADATGTLGMATGGAKDATNFRDNVREGFTPQPDALTHEGVFYDYYFETAGRGDAADEEDEGLFAPAYATAVTDDPLTGETERYLSVGLDSTLSAADFERPRLDLVVVLDVSGSMSSSFREYYYDEHGRRREAEERDGTTKLAAARDALCALTEQLEPTDRLGVVLFNSEAHVAKPLRDVGATDMAAVRSHVQQIEAGGGTNMSAGYEAALDLFDGDGASADVERRVAFMTDAMPNLGATAPDDLLSRVEAAAAEYVHTTFVGMGIDANADLVESLSGVRGANHYFVHSAAEFERRLGEEFDYVVTPLVYDLSLDVVADGYEIAGVYGSPNADAATGEVMHVSTLFPSAKRDGEARGGVVLLELERTGPDPSLDLVASWRERDGTTHERRTAVTLPDEPHVDHDGVRKAVALARYVRVLREWATAVHDGGAGGERVDDWRPRRSAQLAAQERRSRPLVVPEGYAEEFRALRSYLAAEREALGDDGLERELRLLDALLDAA